MEIIVCVRQTAVVREELKVASDGRSVDLSGVNQHLNEWDSYALEEALLLVQENGGSVTVVSLGPENAEPVLFHGLAAGAQDALHIVSVVQDDSDNWVVANMLSREIRKHPFDLVLTGVQAEDDGCGEVGATIATLLGIPHASMVVGVEYEEGQNTLKVERELDEGYHDILRISLPALLTIQTGTRQPRYVSSMRLKRFKKRAKITKVGFEDLVSVGEKIAPRTELIHIDSYQPETRNVEILEGSPEQTVGQLLDRLYSKGVL